MSTENKHEIKVTASLEGWFKCIKKNSNDEVLEETPWFSNLIVDTGLNRIATSGYLRSCHVGTGSSAPVNADTQLGSFVAGSGIPTGDSTVGIQSSSPYYAWRRNVYRFEEGVAEGNLSEVGIADGDDVSDVLFSRALIRDGAGDPTTLTILSDEILEVVYELRIYAPEDDVNDSINDDGPAGTSHATVTRAANVTSGHNTTGWGVGGTGPSARTGANMALSTSGSSVKVYNGNLGSITSEPSGTSSSVGSSVRTTNDSYVTDSHERTATIELELDIANLTDGISAVFYKFNSGGAWQTSFDPAIPKTSDDQLTLGFKVTWQRHDPS